MANEYWVRHSAGPEADLDRSAPSTPRWLSAMRFAMAVTGSAMLAVAGAAVAVQWSDPTAWSIDAAATEDAVTQALHRRDTPAASAFTAWTREIADALDRPGLRDQTGESVEPAGDIALARSWLAAGPDAVGWSELLAHAATKGGVAPPWSDGAMVDAVAEDAAALRAMHAVNVRRVTDGDGLHMPELLWLPEALAAHSAWAPLTSAADDIDLLTGPREAPPRLSARLVRDDAQDIVLYGDLAAVVMDACRQADTVAERAACLNVTGPPEAMSDVSVGLAVAGAGLAGGGGSHPAWSGAVRRGAQAVKAADRRGGLAPALRLLAMDAITSAVDAAEARRRVLAVLARDRSAPMEAGPLIAALTDACADAVRRRRVRELAGVLEPVGAVSEAATPIAADDVLSSARRTDELARLAAVAVIADRRWLALRDAHPGDVSDLAVRRFSPDRGFVIAIIVCVIAACVVVSAFSLRAAPKRRH